jgi:hypothetical protein
MPDDWEGYFAVDDPGGDPDLDGASNVMEFMMGTNPRGSGSSAVSADLWEDDDLASWASEIAVGGTAQAHNFHDTGDVDWVKFMGIPGKGYQVEVFDAGPGCDPVLEVYGSSLQLLGSSNAGGLGDGESVSAMAGSEPGLIYVKARDLDPTAFGTGVAYRLRVRIPGNPFGTIWGKVTQPNGKTIIKDATVEIMAEGFKVTVATDTYGTYYANDLPLGIYSVRASKTGFYSGLATGIDTVNGQARQQDFTLALVTTTAEFMGRVTDAVSGAAVVNVSVWSFFNSRIYSDQTDAAGYYYIAGLPTGTYSRSWNITHPDYQSLSAAQVFAVAGTVVRDFAMTPLVTDADGDGLLDSDEIAIGTSPTDSDSDDDGLSDGYEYNTLHTDPTDWDSDHDGLPDPYEVTNATGHPQNLDPISAADGALNFDADTNQNANEYWNGTDPWTANPVGAAGCAYWGEGDGDLIVGPGDKTALINVTKGAPGSFANLIPPTGETLELDMDLIAGPGDISLLTQFMKGSPIETLGSRPVSLSRVDPVGGTVSVAVGSTTHLTVTVNNASGKHTAGVGVVFELDTGSSAGTATLLGGEGTGGGATRYDTTGSIAGGQSRVVILKKTAGTIIINARVPGCGAEVNIGRYCGTILLDNALTIENP